MLSGVGQIERAAPLVGEAADLGNGNIVAPAGQLHFAAPPHAGFTKELGGDKIHRLVIGQLSIDCHCGSGGRSRLYGLGYCDGNAQGLEVTGGLAVFLVQTAAPALEAGSHRTQRVLLRQQALRQRKLVPQEGGVQIEAGFFIQAAFQGRNLLRRNAVFQLGEGIVGKKGRDILRQAVALVERRLRYADTAAVALPLGETDGEALHALHRREGQHQIVGV